MNERETVLSALMQDAYDIHIHSAPSHFPRKGNDLELLQRAEEQGMKGIVLKSHYDSTASRAMLVNSIAGTRAKAFGGVALNWAVGGLNPDAVECCGRLGGKIVWMPTADAMNAYIYKGEWTAFTRQPRLSLLDENGCLKRVVHDILDVAKEQGMTVATGHINPTESLLLCREGVERNVKMVLTHPEFPCTACSIELQKKLAAKGVMIEKLWFNVGNGLVSADYMAETIREVGAEHCVMATDRGQLAREWPVEGLRLFMGAMLDRGISEAAIRTMTHDNAAWVVE